MCYLRIFTYYGGVFTFSSTFPLCFCFCLNMWDVYVYIVSLTYNFLLLYFSIAYKEIRLQTGHY